MNEKPSKITLNWHVFSKLKPQSHIKKLKDFFCDLYSGKLKIKN